jgi:hypothetical protein
MENVAGKRFRENQSKHLIFNKILNSIFFCIESMAILKIVADMASPCLTPVWTSNFPANSLFVFTIALIPKSVNAISFFNF